MSLKNCWEIKKCGREQGGAKAGELGICAAYPSHGHSCWLVTGTLCGGEVQGTFAQKEMNCLQCETYRRYNPRSGTEKEHLITECACEMTLCLKDMAERINPEIPEELLDALVRALERTLEEQVQDRTRALVQANDALKQEVEERKYAESLIRHMALHDQLTNLPNRTLLTIKLEEALRRVRRGERLAVLYLDLDHFKNVNDTLGHGIGDALLKAVAIRLQNCVRDIDTIARLGGDEFAIIQIGLERPSDAAILATRIGDAITPVYQLEGHQVPADVSIGISVAPNDGNDPEELLKNADLALYRSKTDGRGTFRFFESEMDERVKARRALELDLRNAIVNDEFEVYYQPLVNLERREVTCCEALARWHHPSRGMLEPAEFIPLAEETGLINQIGEWVVRKACYEAATWPDNITVAINLSPVQFKNQALVQAVTDALAASGLAARRLELEITETLLLQKNEKTLVMLHQLRDLGVRIAMDDFGTGYSSLSYLSSFPFDKIKIDRSFIGQIAKSKQNGAIVQAIADLASHLNMTTTAEGVETQEQFKIVQALGCTEMQGYLYSPPVPAKDIVRTLTLHQENSPVAA